MHRDYSLTSFDLCSIPNDRSSLWLANSINPWSADGSNNVHIFPLSWVDSENHVNEFGSRVWGLYWPYLSEQLFFAWYYWSVNLIVTAVPEACNRISFGRIMLVHNSLFWFFCPLYGFVKTWGIVSNISIFPIISKQWWKSNDLALENLVFLESEKMRPTDFCWKHIRRSYSAQFEYIFFIVHNQIYYIRGKNITKTIKFLEPLEFFLYVLFVYQEISHKGFIFTN